MRPTGLAVAMGCAVALVGIAGAASASATIDLIWADTGTGAISDVNSSSQITLQVILTAGAAGAIGAGVSVDYSSVLGTLAVSGFASTPGGALPFTLGETTDTGSRVDNINSASFPPYVGTGLSEGQSHQLGTVTFDKGSLMSGLSAIRTGVYEIRSDADAVVDAVLDLAGNDVSATTTFNSAYLIGAAQCSCDFAIEINALRGGSPTVTVGSTKDITARARIAKGTAVPDRTVDTTLRIDAIDGSEVIDSQSSGPIQLKVGKGGAGDKLTLDINQCNSGSITFEATFFDPDSICGIQCGGRRRITRICD